MKLAVIIQARMTSRRLPGKSLMRIGGRPLLGHVIDNAKLVVDNVIVATPDKMLARYALSQGVEAYIGDEEDVLDRYYKTAEEFMVDDIVRITADNPLVRSETIRKVVSVYLEGYDWVGNCRLKTTYPIGDDVEVFSFEALKKAWQETTLPYDRENVTSYIYNHPELFELGVVENDKDLSHLRWTVDTMEDLERVRGFYGG